ncbi:hypothetical protein [Ekhidna sp.]|uniref:hypothetical protein n=1 Tax=Ekhidna sp. TaxID=2608089 RepID=UPI0032ECE64A
MKKYFLIISCLIFGCNTKDQENAYLLFSNTIDDPNELEVIVALDESQVFNGKIKTANYADKYSLLKVKMKAGDKSLNIALPNLSVDEEFQFEFDSIGVYLITLTHKPITTHEDSLEPVILFREFEDVNDLSAYDSLDLDYLTID